MKKMILAALLGASSVLALGFAQYKYQLIPGVVIATESEINAFGQYVAAMVLATCGRGS